MGNMNAAEAANVTGTHTSNKGTPICIAIAAMSGSNMATEAKFELTSVIAKVAMVKPTINAHTGH